MKIDSLIAPLPNPAKEGEITSTGRRWSDSRSKRLFDVIFAVPLLIAGFPLMAIIALAVKLDSRGPVFFRQYRAGKDGAQFSIIKFRTMLAGVSGPRLTRRADSRITAVGRVIRRCKLDELPQLWNVICGEMSLVGPRPDLPEYYAELDQRQKQILQLRPGITSPASLRFCDEEELLCKVQPRDLTAYYVDVLLPEKIRLELDYASRATFLSDLGVLLQTILTTLPWAKSRT